ncbi:MAG: hypothetical protein ACKPAE_13895, partial [Microcystis panniformis]
TAKARFCQGMKIKFLLDENLSPRLKVAVLRLNPEIDILRVGEPNTPLLGTLDPDVLQYLGLSQRLLVTDNRTSMPEHLEEYWQKNQQIWGLFWIRPTTTMGKLAKELIIIWETTEAEEWIDIVDWIPF